MKLLLILVILLITLKWIGFILISPIIVYKGKLDKAKNNKVDKGKPLPKTTYSFKTKVLYFVMGLIRYYDIQIGLLPSHSLRNFIYKRIFGVNIGKNAVIYYGAEIRDHVNLKIGAGSIIGDRAILDARNGIEIGDNVNFSSAVSIWTEQHDYRDPYFRCVSGPDFNVKIKDRAWIGPNVIILHSVTIGENAVVGAGSVVTKDVPPNTVVAGIPAKEIGKRPQNMKYKFDGRHVSFY